MKPCSNLRRSALVISTFALLASSVRTQAAIFNSNPIADAMVVAAQPNSNYGGAGAVAIAPPGLAQGEFQSLLRFDLAAAKSSFDTTYGVGQWSIQSVSLLLSAAPNNNAIFNNPAAGQFAASWMQNDGWTEGAGTPQTPTATGITFNTLPSFLSGSDQGLGTFNFIGGTTGQATYALGASSGLNGDILAGGLASLRLLAADAGLSYIIKSRTFTTVADRPILSIEAVPEPGCAAIAALTMLCVSRRRR